LNKPKQSVKKRSVVSVRKRRKNIICRKGVGFARSKDGTNRRSGINSRVRRWRGNGTNVSRKLILRA
jgi:hypothetical protein